MKYVLVDKNTGYFVQSTRSSFRVEFSKEIHDSALFASAENAGKALRKIYDKNGDYKCGQWSLKPDTDEEYPTVFFVTEARQDKEVAELEQTSCFKDRAEEEKKYPVKGFDLEIRAIQFTLV